MSDQTTLLVIIGLGAGFGVAIGITSKFLLQGSERDFFTSLKVGFGASPWFLTQGRESDRYYDLDLVLRDPKATRRVTDWYASAVEDVERRHGRVDRLVFFEKDSGPVGALVLAGALIEKTGVPGMIVRPRRKFQVASVKGACQITKDAVVVLISDVATTGTSMEAALDVLIERGIRPTEAIVYVKRNVATTRLGELGIHLTYGMELAEGAALEGILANEKTSSVK
jgi:orotate phosphoribosyltransferase